MLTHRKFKGLKGLNEKYEMIFTRLFNGISSATPLEEVGGLINCLCVIALKCHVFPSESHIDQLMKSAFQSHHTE
jgi:hypothetical protein